MRGLVIPGVDVARSGGDSPSSTGASSGPEAVQADGNQHHAVRGHRVKFNPEEKPDAIFPDMGAMGPASTTNWQLGVPVQGVQFGGRR